MEPTEMVVYQWIGLRENLQETIDFPMTYGTFLQIFPSKPIHWLWWLDHQEFFMDNAEMNGNDAFTIKLIWGVLWEYQGNLGE